MTPALVCQVQGALRWGRPAWTAKRCQDVAAALSVLPDPMTTLAIMANESNMNEKSIRRAGPSKCDVGLPGIRCQLGDAGKCVNGAARGYTPAQLMDPVTSIRVAHVLATSMGPRYLHRWNGDPGYAERIRVLALAVAGVPVEIKGKGAGAKWKRVREMVRRIAAAVKNAT